jgi:ribonuclease HI
LFTFCKYQDAKPISSGASPNHSQSPEARSRIINDENQETEAGKSSGDKLALTTMLNDSSLQLGQLPPPEGSVKLNVDGSFCKEMGVGGAGVVLRDDRGAIIVSKSLSLQPCLSPLEAELEACREGVILALDWSSLPCMIEMDCAEAVNMIRSGELNRSPFTGLIQEIKRLMATRSNLVIGTISREQNSVSHILANLGRTSARTQTWAGSGPDDVTALCRSECNSLA